MTIETATQDTVRPWNAGVRDRGRPGADGDLRRLQRPGAAGPGPAAALVRTRARLHLVRHRALLLSSGCPLVPIIVARVSAIGESPPLR